MCWTSKVPLFPPFFLIPITWRIFIPWPRLTVGLRGGPWHGDEIGRSFGSGGPYRGLGPGGESVTAVTESRADSRAERSVSSTSGRPHLAGLCEGEHGPLEHCCRRITGCWHFFKKSFKTSGVRSKLFSLVLYHSRLSLSLSSFQECRVLWSQRLSQI